MSDSTPDRPLPETESAPAPAVVVVADGVEKRLDPNVIVAWRIGFGILAAITTVGSMIPAIVFFFTGELPKWAQPLLPVGWLLIVAAGVSLVIFWPPVRYRHWSYRVLPDGMEIKKGVLWRTVVHVPKTRIQHTDVSRNPFDRWLGLAKLVIYTAGTEHASIQVEGLPHAEAFAIRDHLIPAGGDDAV